MNYRLILGGLKSYLPIPTASYMGTGGSSSGPYCYSIWMRHLVLINRCKTPFRPEVVVELGPGDSIGLGLAAHLSGAKRYFGLDVLPHALAQQNERVLAELVPLFRQRAAIPGKEMFPGVLPRLSDYSYPNGLLDEGVVANRLAGESLRGLEEAVRNPNDLNSPIRYLCPWAADSVPEGSADLVISHGALQDMDHLPQRDDLLRNLEAMTRWLKPGGIMSHHIELGCPGGTPWNHHWGYGKLAWKLIRGNRPYYKNRVPLSEYVRLLSDLNMRVLHVEATPGEGLSRDRLAAEFRSLPDSDLNSRAALIIAEKV